MFNIYPQILCSQVIFYLNHNKLSSRIVGAAGGRSDSTAQEVEIPAERDEDEKQ